MSSRSRVVTLALGAVLILGAVYLARAPPSSKDDKKKKTKNKKNKKNKASSNGEASSRCGGETAEECVHRWFTWAMQQQGVSEVWQKEMWNKVRDAYSEQGRQYHTLQHLQEMLDLLQSAQGNKETRAKDLVCVVLATLFHDLVYNASSSHNEEDSAEFFRYFAKQVKLDAVLSKKVGAYVLATKTHDVSASLDRDLRLFVDMDMAVLGRPTRTGPGGYAEYAARIRSEYAHVSDADYCTARAAFLAAASGGRSKPIYATSAYRASHEEAAHANMLWEADELLAGRIPGEEDEATGRRRKE